MSEVLTGIIAAVSALIGIGIREWTLRRQRGRRVDAAALLDEATATETIAETFKGLLTVIRDDLTSTQAELAETKNEVRGLRRELDAEKQRTRELTAEVSRLEGLLSEQENS